MKLVKWIARISIGLLMIDILRGNSVDVIYGILWFIMGIFVYLFFLEHWYMNIAADRDNETWWLVAHKLYKSYDVPYYKFMWCSFIVMLQDDYED